MDLEEGGGASSLTKHRHGKFAATPTFSQQCIIVDQYIVTNS
jgi:hypothetical protein